MANELTVGQGLSIQAKPKMYEHEFIKLLGEPNRRKAARDKDQFKELGDLKKSIMVSKNLHPVYAKAAQKVGEETLAQWVDSYRNDPDDRFARMRIGQQAVDKMAEINAFSKQAWDFEHTPKNQLPEEAIQAMSALHSSPNWETFVKTAGPLQSDYLQIGEQGGIAIKPKPAAVDIAGKAKGLYNTYITNMQPVWEGLRTSGNQYLIDKTQTIPKTAAEATALEQELQSKLGHEVVIPSVEELLGGLYADQAVNEQHRYTNRAKKMAEEDLQKSFMEEYASQFPTKFSTTMKTIPRPRAEKTGKTWSSEGSRYTNGDNIWDYSKVGDMETWTFSKKNAPENAEMIFEQTGNKTIRGVPVRLEKEVKQNRPTLIIAVKKKYSPQEAIAAGNVSLTGQEHIEDVPIEYSAYNAGKIKNEFGNDPWGVRKGVTGSLKIPEGNFTGSEKESRVKSTSKSTGASFSDRQQRALDAFIKQFGKEPTDAQLQKILEKYK